ncbi:MAG TPA: hypothetical protein VNZ22_02840, partial [Bacillota bacterium]|nr:hypothetical protein [Bacillota bacterium]
MPPNTVIPANGYLLFTEADWNANPESPTSFRLDSHGETIYLYSADTNGNLTGYSDGFAFGAAQNGVSFGRYVNSTGEAQYPAQRANSLGQPNVGPRVGPVVINEIHYHPGPGGDAFIELKSLTNGPVPLFDPLFPTNTWRLNGLAFAFPTNVTLAPTGLALVVSIDPATFRSKYSVPAAVPIFGPYPGSLQGGGESVALQFPDHPDWDTNSGTVYIPYVDVDVVRYNDKLPWPTNADGAGASLERITAAAYGNDPINWRASLGAPSPGFDNDANRLPQVYAGPDQSLAVTQVPVAITLAGTASDDGRPQPPGALSVGWKQVSGPAPAWFSQPNQPRTTAFFPGAGNYILRLTAGDGELQASDEVAISIQRPLEPSPTTLIAKGSIWKYLDNGSNQGTAWTARTFNDTNWLSGPAPLGYGDANGQWPATTNAYGPYLNNRYVTTYYRRSFSVANPALVTNLVVSVQRDDGVVVYLNGTGIFTNNMPTNSPIGYLTNATGVVGGADETTFYSQAVAASLLMPGLNVVAAEIHQANASSSDIIFDLELAGESLPVNQAPSAYAGPDQSLALPASAVLSGSASDDA